MVNYYLPELTMLLGAAIIGIAFMIGEKKTETESEQDVQQRMKETNR